MQGEQTRLPGSNLKSKRGKRGSWPKSHMAFDFYGPINSCNFFASQVKQSNAVKELFLAFDDAVGLSCENFNSDELHNIFCAPHCAVTQQTNWPDV